MTASAIIETSVAPQLGVGETVKVTLGVLRARALDLFLIGLPFVLLPSVLIGFLPENLWQPRLAVGLPALVFIGGVSLLTYRDLSGGARLSAGGAISAGARRLGTLWGVGFLSGLGFLAGLLLLIVPGVILIAAWVPANAAAMVEELTASAALSRAWALTKGSRWRIAALLGIALAAIVILLLIQVLLGALLTALLGAETGTAITTFAISPLADILTTALTTVGSAAVYVGLREAKEGAVGDVAKVFE